MPSTSKGFRYPVGSDSPTIATFFANLANDVNNWLYVGDRYRTFQRATGTGTDSYTSASGLTLLVGGTWSSAPAGDYLVHTTLVISGDASPRGGNIEVRAAGAAISTANTRADVTTAATTITHTHPYTHGAAGNLTIGGYHSITTGTATVYNASCKQVLEYLGRRV